MEGEFMIPKPLVSIIIPVYKVEKYLEECLESVVSQTYTKLEIILVDDGSPDRCPEMCDDWAKKDERIKVIHKKNGGLSSARNVGLDICTGDFILFVDSDDKIYRNTVKNLLECQEHTDADMVIFNFCRDVSYLGTGSKKEKKIEKEQAMINSVRLVNYITAWSKLYRKKLLKDLRFKIGKLHEDEYICCNIFRLADNIIEYDENLYYYRKTDNSIINSKPTMKNFVDAMEAIDERIAFLKNNGYNEAYDANLVCYYTVFFGLYPEVEAITSQDKKIKKYYKEKIKSILPQLKNHPLLPEFGHRFILFIMSFSIDFAMWIVAAKRKFIK